MPQRVLASDDESRHRLDHGANMLSLSLPLARTIADRHGVVTLDELILDGISDAQIRRAVTDGGLSRQHRGVYRLATAPDSFEAACVAACLADHEAVVTGVAAARLWEFRHVFRPERPVVLVSHDRRPLTNNVLVRRTNVLDPEDWVPRGDGIRVASPPRAWFDCARDLDDVRFERLTEWVLDHHATVPSLWRMRRRLNVKGRPGLARVNRILSRRSVWQRPAGSGLELDVLNAPKAATGSCGGPDGRSTASPTSSCRSASRRRSTSWSN